MKSKFEELEKVLTRMQARGDEKPLIDTKLPGPPKEFYGRQAEWRDWSYIFSQYLAAVSSRLVDRTKHYGNESAIMSDLGEEDRRWGQQL